MTIFSFSPQGIGSKPCELILQARLRLAQFAVSHSMEEFLQALLDEIEALTNSRIGFCHFLAADQKTLSLQAWSTNTLLRMCKAEGKGRHYDVAQAGVWADCIRESRPVIHNDYSALKHRKGLPQGHPEVVRELVAPVVRGDRIVAVLGVGNKPHEYDKGDVEIVNLIADLAWDIVERKRTQESLKETEGEFRDLAEKSVVGVYLIQDSIFKYVNPMLAEIFGYTVEELIDKKGPEDLVLPRDWPIVRENLRKRIAGEMEAVHYIFRGIKKNKEVIYLEVYGSKTVYKTRPAVIGTLLDVTRRRETEEALHESVKRYRDLFDSTLDGIYRVDARDVFVQMNPAGAMIFGHESPDEIIGRNYTDYCRNPKDREAFLSELKIKKAVSAFHMRAKNKNGEPVEIESSSRIIEDEEGNFLGIEGILRDVTERKRAEKRIEHLLADVTKAKDEWEKTFDSAMELIVLVDKTHKILRCNKSFADFFGVPIKELTGQYSFDYLPYAPEEIESCKGWKGNNLVRFEVETERGFWFYLSFCPICDEKNECANYVITANDITELKAIQERLLKSEKELKKRVDELERFYEMAVNRELKMQEMKRKLQKLSAGSETTGRVDKD
jgi:PAS domain S-box-containing protein